MRNLKNVFAILFAIVVTFCISSCSNSKEEQMILDYQNENLKEYLNLTVDVLKVDIVSLETVGEIKASDSLFILAKEASEFWFGTGNEVIYPVTYQLISDSINSYIEQENNSYERRLEEKREEYSWMMIKPKYMDEESFQKFGITEEDIKRFVEKDIKSKVDRYEEALEKIETQLSCFNEYSKDPNRTLCVIYKCAYTQMNPLLKIEQSFEKFYITNSSQSKIVAGIDSKSDELAFAIK